MQCPLDILQTGVFINHFSAAVADPSGDAIQDQKVSFLLVMEGGCAFAEQRHAARTLWGIGGGGDSNFWHRVGVRTSVWIAG
jgi:hypothetical protein